MKIFKLTILFLIVTASAVAQDFHFSQYWGGPLHLNPALTGVFNDNVRLNANYRNQWFDLNTFTTYAIAADANLFRKKLNGNFLGIGMSFYQDIEGEGDFQNTGASLSLAYTQRIGKYKNKHYLSFGMQGGLNRKQINLQNLVYGTLFSDNNNSDPIDIQGYDAKAIFDFNTGINYFANFDNKHNVGFGFAVSHISQPNISFGSETSDVLYRKFSFNTSASILLNNSIFSILPTMLFQKQGPHQEINSGVYLRVLLNELKNTAIYAGGMYRISAYDASNFGSDAFIAGFRMEYQSLDIGVSYDITTSNLRNAANFVGGPEIYIIYTIPTSMSRTRDRLNCPKF